MTADCKLDRKWILSALSLADRLYVQSRRCLRATYLLCCGGGRVKQHLYGPPCRLKIQCSNDQKASWAVRWDSTHVEQCFNMLEPKIWVALPELQKLHSHGEKGPLWKSGWRGWSGVTLFFCSKHIQLRRMRKSTGEKGELKLYSSTPKQNWNRNNLAPVNRGM